MSWMDVDNQLRRLCHMDEHILLQMVPKLVPKTLFLPALQVSIHSTVVKGEVETI